MDGWITLLMLLTTAAVALGGVAVINHQLNKRHPLPPEEDKPAGDPPGDG